MQVGDFLLTKDATPGVAFTVKDSIEGLFSSGILKLKINEKEVEKEYLALCINSLVGKLQVVRDSGGSVITHWRPDQIENLKIPILSRDFQQNISRLVTESYEVRKKANYIFDKAKSIIEIETQKIAK